jgi:hypothetical protein
MRFATAESGERIDGVTRELGGGAAGIEQMQAIGVG